jgi:hypothetical protein
LKIKVLGTHRKEPPLRAPNYPALEGQIVELRQQTGFP